MKTIDATTLVPTGDKTSALEKARERLSRSWSPKEAEGAEMVCAVLQRTLDNRFFLLQGVTLPGPDVPIPLILVGPPGVRVIYPSAVKGIFRAREDVWEELSSGSQSYKLSRPNLIARAQLMAQSVQDHLEGRGQQVFDVEPVLFFSNAGAHIEFSRPVVRIVLADGLERLAAGLLQAPAVLDASTVQNVVDILAPQLIPDTLPDAPEIQDAFSFKEHPASKAARKPAPAEQAVKQPSLVEKIPFSKRQWTILAVLLAITIVILFSLVLFIVLTAG